MNRMVYTWYINIVMEFRNCQIIAAREGEEKRMNETVQNYMEGYNKEIQLLFTQLRNLIMETVTDKIEEKLWAKLPSFYVGERFVRIIPFKDHINIEAVKIRDYISQLDQYKITAKGMLQIYIDQDIPYDILRKVFIDTLT